MTPPINSHVKILLRNNTITEGIVQEWSNIVKLQSLDDQSYMIIFHPEDDIILLKVFLDQAPAEKVKIISKEQSELEEKFQRIVEQPSDDLNRHQNLAELRVQLAKQERQIIANKLKDHHIGQTQKVTYEQPRFFPKPSSE